MCRWFCWLRNQESVAPVHMLADFLTIYGFFSPILVVVIATSPTSFSVKGTVLVGHQPEFHWTAAGPDPPAPQSNPTRKPSPKNPRKTKNHELKNDGKKTWEISNLNAMSFCPTKSLSFRCSSSKQTCFFFSGADEARSTTPLRYPNKKYTCKNRCCNSHLFLTEKQWYSAGVGVCFQCMSCVIRSANHFLTLHSNFNGFAS